MNIGVILPSFRRSPDDAIEVALAAEALGLDGVFCYDHLWPMHQPERPALAPFSLLASIAARTERIALGTLVARIGIVSNDVLVAQFRTLRYIAGDRVIAGVGTGDRLSEEENRAFGLAYTPAQQRRADLEEVAATLVADGFEVWVGGGAGATNEIAPRVGAKLNLFGAPFDRVEELSATAAITWAGLRSSEVGSDPRRLAARGVSWAVMAYPCELAELAQLRAELTP